MCIYFLWLPNILLITWITEQNQLPLCRAQSCLLVEGCLHEICGSAVGSGTGSFESCGMKDSGLYRRGLFRGMLKMLHEIGISALVSWFLKLFVNSPAGGGSSCWGSYINLFLVIVRLKVRIHIIQICLLGYKCELAILISWSSCGMTWQPETTESQSRSVTSSDYGQKVAVTGDIFSTCISIQIQMQATGVWNVHKWPAVGYKAMHDEPIVSSVDAA